MTRRCFPVGLHGGHGADGFAPSSPDVECDHSFAVSVVACHDEFGVCVIPQKWQLARTDGTQWLRIEGCLQVSDEIVLNAQLVGEVEV